MQNIKDIIYFDTGYKHYFNDKNGNIVKEKNADGKEINKEKTIDHYKAISEGSSVLDMIEKSPMAELIKKARDINKKILEDRWFRDYPHDQEGEIERINLAISGLEKQAAKLKSSGIYKKPEGLMSKIDRALADPDGAEAAELTDSRITKTEMLKLKELFDVDIIIDPFAKDVVNAIKLDQDNPDSNKKSKKNRKLLKAQGLIESEIDHLMENMHSLNNETQNEIRKILKLPLQSTHGIINQLTRAKEEKSWYHRKAEELKASIGYKSKAWYGWGRDLDDDTADKLKDKSMEKIMKKLQSSDVDRRVGPKASDIEEVMENKPESKKIAKKYGRSIFASVLVGFAMFTAVKAVHMVAIETAIEKGDVVAAQTYNKDVRAATEAGIAAQKAVDQKGINEYAAKRDAAEKAKVAAAKEEADKALAESKAQTEKQKVEAEKAKVEADKKLAEAEKQKAEADKKKLEEDGARRLETEKKHLEDQKRINELKEQLNREAEARTKNSLNSVEQSRRADMSQEELRAQEQRRAGMRAGQPSDNFKYNIPQNNQDITQNPNAPQIAPVPTDGSGAYKYNDPYKKPTYTQNTQSNVRMSPDTYRLLQQNPDMRVQRITVKMPNGQFATYVVTPKEISVNDYLKRMLASSVLSVMNNTRIVVNTNNNNN